jgi:inner membrane protein
MDTITHLALGAVVGEAMLGKKIGKKALAIGAIAQFLPDIDVVASLWLTPADNLLAHRGFTHSFLFIPLASIVLTAIAHRWQRVHTVAPWQWFMFFFTQLLIHDLIDGFNAYGVGWLIPFNPIRVSFNTLFVIDPLFSVWLIIGAVALIIIKHDNLNRKHWAVVTLLIGCCYLVYALYNKYTVNTETTKLLAKQEVSYQRYFTTPTAFNTWLWFIVAEDEHGYHLGYRSVFDSTTHLALEYFPRQDSLLKLATNKNELQQLVRFSQGYYTVEQTDSALLFNNLRFGQIAGWHTPRAPFAFHYYLNNADDNLMVIQRGRFTGWNKETANSLVKRIKGN